MKNIFSKPLFIFEMANNHQGNLEHGREIIRRIKDECFNYDFHFACKFQYRNLETFIHPDYLTARDVKHVKRFLETKLEQNEFLALRNELDAHSFFSICTPFDEKSVDLIEAHGFDIIKVASCSVSDWSLLERIAETGKPVIASTAGSPVSEIDKLVSFFSNRNIDLTIMHCVAEYPTIPANLQLNQIDLLRHNYPGIRIGYSTHEEPDNFDAIKIAIAKGASVFEKHIGVATDNLALNSYSANPEQVRKWLASAQAAFTMCGSINVRYEPTEKEKADLASLKRGVFASKEITQGEKIDYSNIYFAFPSVEGQLLANNISKYHDYYLENKSVLPNQPVMIKAISQLDNRPMVETFVKQILNQVRQSNAIIPVNSKCELSHHFNLSQFNKYGAAIINCVNREYCKKIIVVLPGQHHPVHFHQIKEETFTVLSGELDLELNGMQKSLKPGESVIIGRGQKHAFSSVNGVVFEEISTTHLVDDSFYDDKRINANKHRKTEVYFTKDLLK